MTYIMLLCGILCCSYEKTWDHNNFRLVIISPTIYESRSRQGSCRCLALGSMQSDPGSGTCYLEAHGTSEETPRCPLKGSLEGDRGPYKG